MHFCDPRLGCAIAPYYKTLEIFNMNLPFFPIIYNIILTVFLLRFFQDISMASPGGAFFYMTGGFDTKKDTGKHFQFGKMFCSKWDKN